MSEAPLLVIISHRPSVILEKGEYTEGYFNPGGLFENIHFVLLNDDQPKPSDLVRAAAGAQVHIHNLPVPDIRSTLGWQLPLMRSWVREGIRLANDIRPVLIRAHNNYLEGYLASEIKAALHIPYIVSIHHEHWQHQDNLKEFVLARVWRKFERLSARNADGVIAVHGPNFQYANSLQGNNVQLIYNIVSKEIQRRLPDQLASPPRLITVNRQMKYKNPENIIRAIVDIDCEYRIVGTGPYHQQLMTLAKELGVDHKVEFLQAVNNQELMDMLSKFDLHVSHCGFWAMSKTVTEASLAGLPTVINFHPEHAVPEYEGGWILQCENTPEGYKQAIRSVLEDTSRWRDLAEKAYAHAHANFAPQLMEERTIELYMSAMSDTAN
ncbi:MAG: glycosyltransferase [Chloroflexi bacterium]|nr:MAG: glycosyltransferase [Chloroflexota bacterium]MBL1193144.1 glycosyltransferase [Chloroflexota bacterium]NOH10437.1 glycosyltransferase family 4 protein [Chloroflexota bacterium]